MGTLRSHLGRLQTFDHTPTRNKATKSGWHDAVVKILLPISKVNKMFARKLKLEEILKRPARSANQNLSIDSWTIERKTNLWYVLLDTCTVHLMQNELSVKTFCEIDFERKARIRMRWPTS